MTEDQAKQTTCLKDSATRTTMCMASQCMAWRWRAEYQDDGGIWRFGPPQHDGQTTRRTDGFCGLAGSEGAP